MTITIHQSEMSKMAFMITITLMPTRAKHTYRGVPQYPAPVREPIYYVPPSEKKLRSRLEPPWLRQRGSASGPGGYTGPSVIGVWRDVLQQEYSQLGAGLATDLGRV